MKEKTIEELQQEVAELEEKNIKLRDECDTLWDLLDEMRSSDIHKFSEQLQETIISAQETAYYRALLKGKTGKGSKND
jgi:uncharacterized coiled-coil protein SlyX